MNFVGNWKAKFVELCGDAETKFHFDLTDVMTDGKIDGVDISTFINNPVSNTQWEISTLFNKYLDKFKQTVFHLGDKEYLGTEIFDIKK